MLNCFVTAIESPATPVLLITKAQTAAWIAKQDAFTKNWLSASTYEPGTSILIPNSDGAMGRVACFIADEKDFWSVAHLPLTLPAGIYHFEALQDETRFAIAWGLGAYQFTRYKSPNKTVAQLFLSDALKAKHIFNMVESSCWVRDLINTPTDDLGPSEFAAEAALLAKDFDAEIHQIVGEDLLKHNYSAIYTVGRASDDAPRLVELRWGSTKHRKLTLVGKGVCFDSGGLDIKPASAMTSMKKDMAGAAHVLGLARMIMREKLPIQLRVLIPMVENAISGNAYRPGDIIKSRQGLTIEVGNTDAEGRLVLADALAEAVNEKPDLLIDMATLTGAGRVALGTDLAAMFCNEDNMADHLVAQGKEEFDPLWRLPLYEPYRDLLSSTIADMSNISSEPYGGAITAALFLKAFVPDPMPWIHFDMMAWNLKARPGRPVGGEANALRALFGYLKAHFV